MPQEVTGFERIYPHIARWVQSYGWIEMGADHYSRSLVRALDEGGMVWESQEDDTTLDHTQCSTPRPTNRPYRASNRLKEGRNVVLQVDGLLE